MNIDDKCRELIGKTHSVDYCKRIYGEPIIQVNDIIGFTLDIDKGKMKVLYRIQSDNSLQVYDCWYQSEVADNE